MKYYSEITRKTYDSAEACEKAEAEVEAARVEKEAAAKKKSEERAARAKEVEDAYQSYLDAQKVANEKNKEYKKLLDAFLKDYGYYHSTIKLGVPSVNDLFFDFLTNF